MNPARAKLLTRKQKLSDFRWSSYSQYVQSRAARPGWLRVDRLLGEHGIPKDSPVGRQQFERRMELRRGAEDGDEFRTLQRGWCLGSQEFRQELLAQMSAGPEHYGEEIRKSGEEKGMRPTFLLAAPEAASWSSRPCSFGRRVFSCIHPSRFSPLDPRPLKGPHMDKPW
jgi:hypothetical protein